MANFVQSNYEALQQISQRFQSRAQLLLKTTTAISHCCTRLQQSWEGQGADAFTQEMNRIVLPAMARLHQAFQSAAQTTGKIARTMQIAEEEAAALFRSESSDIAIDNRGGGDLSTPVSEDANPDATPEPEATAEPDSAVTREVPFQSATLPIASENITWQGGFGPNQFASTQYTVRSTAMAALQETIDAVEAPTEVEIADWDKQRKAINNAYPYENTGGLHGGLDFGADAGTEVTAIIEGEIVDIYSRDASPNVVVRYGDEDDGYYVIYGHVDMNADLEVGGTVAAGDVLGTVQDQGGNSHLHLAVRQDNQVYNPLYVFDDASGAGGVFENANYPEGEDATSMYSFEYTSEANYWATPEAPELEIEE